MHTGLEVFGAVPMHTGLEVCGIGPTEVCRAVPIFTDIEFFGQVLMHIL